MKTNELKTIYYFVSYKERIFRKVCYYATYFDVDDLRKCACSIPTKNDVKAFFLQMKKGINTSWKMGLIDDDEKRCEIKYLNIVRHCIMNHFTFYKLVCFFNRHACRVNKNAL